MLVSVSEYAALKEITPAAVSKAAKEGRLRNSVRRGANGRIEKIDVILANKEWEQNTDPSKVRGKNKTPTDAAPAEAAPPPPETMQLPLPDSPSLSSSRNRLEAYKANLAKLEYEERSGKLVDAEAVKNEAFKMARVVRDALMNVPDRLASELAGITDAHAVHQRITDEIRVALEGLINA